MGMDGINTAGSTADVARIAATPSTPVTAKAATPSATKIAAETANLISLLADAAPPIDSKKVQAIQSLIAAGAYPIDPHAIAAKMLALDFPEPGADADA
ncbi:MAG: flgM [Sphingomonas bacterium]|jgi:negative regulator of flagellin synthesis FlgM|nr:flgM [Sphingomonas bacterium]